jgi:hypothetical protein
MARFLFKLALFLAVQCVVAAIVVANYRVDKNSFMAAVADKHFRLEHTSSPRVVLVGGSNVCFGTDSALIKQSLDVEPVDMALQGSLGLEYMLREVQDHVRPGDVVVLSPEYEQFAGSVQDVVTLMRLIEQRPSASNDFEWNWSMVKMALDEGHLCAREIVVRSVQRMRTGAVPSSARPYRLDCLNEFGDVTAHLRMQPNTNAVRRASLNFGNSFEDHLQRTIRRLNDFDEHCRTRGATVFLFFPAIPQHCYKESEGKLSLIAERLARDCTVPRLNTVEEMVYPEADFFDTVYHLGAAGVRRRTNLLITRLAAR